MSTPKSKTFEQEIEAYNSFLARYSGETQKMYRTDLHILFIWLGERGVGRFKASPMDLELFGRYLEEGRHNKPASVRRRLTTVRSFYTHCHSNGWIRRNPAATLRLPTLYENGEQHYGLNRLEMSLLLNAAIKRSPQDGALVALMMIMGLRVSTALSFNVGDLDLVEHGHRILKYITKFKKMGKTPIPVPVARILDAAAEGRDPREPLITRRNGLRMDRRAAYARLKCISKLAGLPYEKIHPHTLRRSAITAALDSGVPVRDVQQFANHADARQTLRYDTNNQGLDKHPVYMLSGLVTT